MFMMSFCNKHYCHVVIFVLCFCDTIAGKVDYELYWPTFVVEQSCGHDVMYREKFDVAIARAVAEMRVLGTFVTTFQVEK